MAFKLPGKSMISGSAPHRSALKMKKESMAKMKTMAKMKKESMAKMKSPIKGAYEDALKKDANLPKYIEQRRALKKANPDGYKTSKEYAKIQNKINAAYGVSKRYDEGPSETPKIDKSIEKVQKKGGEKISKTISKAQKKIGEISENVDRKVTRKDLRRIKKTSGKESQEFKDAKVQRERARLTDLEGGKGGKKAVLLGNLRRRLSRKRLEKAEDKANSPATMKKESMAKMKKDGAMKMKKESMAKMKKEGAMKMKKESAMKMKKKGAMKMKKEGAMKMKKAPNKFNAKLKAASAAGKLSGKFKEAVDAAPVKMKKKMKK